MAKRQTLYMHDNETAKWEHDGESYCLHIQQDSDPFNPRTDYDNLTIMACWHRRYDLGDEIVEKEPKEFWRNLVRNNVPNSEIVKAIEDGKLPGIRLAQNAENPDLVDIYETYYLETVIGHSESAENLEYKGVFRDAVYEYLEDDLTVRHCMMLMEPYAEWLPLWLYDHGGITMSCGARTGQYADNWDSGQVGWIIVLKQTIMNECMGEYVLDEAGERIKLENGQYKIKPLTEDNWKTRAVEIMKNDVERYDQYLTGDVYGYTLYKSNGEDDWEEDESCWGFFGSDVLENGIADEVGCGFLEAVKADKVVFGTAKLCTISYYTF